MEASKKNRIKNTAIIIEGVVILGLFFGIIGSAFINKSGGSKPVEPKVYNIIYNTGHYDSFDTKKDYKIDYAHTFHLEGDQWAQMKLTHYVDEVNRTFKLSETSPKYKFDETYEHVYDVENPYIVISNVTNYSEFQIDSVLYKLTFDRKTVFSKEDMNYISEVNGYEFYEYNKVLYKVDLSKQYITYGNDKIIANLSALVFDSYSDFYEINLDLNKVYHKNLDGTSVDAFDFDNKIVISNMLYKYNATSYLFEFIPVNQNSLKSGITVDLPKTYVEGEDVFIPRCGKTYTYMDVLLGTSITNAGEIIDKSELSGKIGYRSPKGFVAGGINARKQALNGDYLVVKNPTGDLNIYLTYNNPYS